MQRAGHAWKLSGLAGFWSRCWQALRLKGKDRTMQGKVRVNPNPSRARLEALRAGGVLEQVLAEIQVGGLRHAALVQRAPGRHPEHDVHQLCASATDCGVNACAGAAGGASAACVAFAVEEVLSVAAGWVPCFMNIIQTEVRHARRRYAAPCPGTPLCVIQDAPEVSSTVCGGNQAMREDMSTPYTCPHQISDVCDSDAPVVSSTVLP